MQLHKPYRTIDEQIQLLTSRGMSVGPEAKHALQREGYYAIVNGYKDQFLDRRASQRVGDDRYIEGTRFDDLYALFRFDRELRSLLFQGITPAEATLKAICSHEFTKAYPSESNPYLNPHNYDSQSYSSACKLIDKVFRRILESNRTEHNGRHAGKAYIRHCLNDHNGQVPLWVLANDLSLGQIAWFFQISAPQVRLAVAESFTDLYADTHDTPRKSPSNDSIPSMADWCSSETYAHMMNAAIAPMPTNASTSPCSSWSMTCHTCLTKSHT
ncbi:Abi family protein [Bifidobacterium pullorum subsp. saeculare DSM 6531 = LMG 14934]|uniref:Abi family protein n=1 Tax=Bifidobacterium pullorum subsp. saeculare DSM 6531 = LMG 14934 TaxID=1437611 RepID=A0A087CP29_9BIFI|nr:Abi family protein [Bifidobacterium pullorum]KFI85029.1 Abi family protein [Bifidobacterium pullorum subsp. saeculare DSM 6531 = LMG 14934]